MDSILTKIKNNREIKIVDVLPKGKSFDYQTRQGEIVVRKDEDFDIPCFNVRAKGWYSATVCLRSKLKVRWRVSVFMIKLLVALLF